MSFKFLKEHRFIKIMFGICLLITFLLSCNFYYKIIPIQESIGYMIAIWVGYIALFLNRKDYEEVYNQTFVKDK